MERGDTYVIEKLFRSHYARLYRIAFSLLRDEEESKDIVSGVFAKVCEGEVILRKGGEEASLVVCVRNASLNAISRKRLHERLMRLYPISDETLSTLPVVEEERLRQMYEFMDKGMTPQTSRIFKLCYGERRTYKEAAEVAGVSVSTVNKHIVRALGALRDKFGKKA